MTTNDGLLLWNYDVMFWNLLVYSLVLYLLKELIARGGILS